MMDIKKEKCQYFSLGQYETAGNFKLLEMKLLTSKNVDK